MGNERGIVKREGGGLVVVTLLVVAVGVAPLVLMLASTLDGDVTALYSHLDPAVFDRLVNSVVLAGLATVLCLLLGVPFAWAIHRREFFGRRLCGLAYVLPLLIPAHIQTISWMRILGRQGTLKEWFGRWGIALDVRQGFLEVGGEALLYPGAVWILAAIYWPFVALMTSAGLSRLDSRQEEAGMLMASSDRVFRAITLPRLRPFVYTGGFFCFIFAIGCYAVPALLDTPTIMQNIYFPSYKNVDMRVRAVVALPLVGTCLLALTFFLLSAGRDAVGRGQSTATKPPSRPRSLGAGLFAWGVLALTVGWPLGAVIAKAGPPVQYRAVWLNVGEQLADSMILSVTTAFLLGVLGVVVAFGLERMTKRAAAAAEVAVLLPFVFPAVVVGVAFNLFWSRFESNAWIDRVVYQGPVILILVYLALFLPFAVRSIRSGLSRLDPALFEAAALTPRSPLAVFGRVTLPLLRPAIAAGMLIGFILTLGELAAGLIVSPARWQTAQTRIFNMIHFARDEEVAALCIILVGVALVPTVLYALVFNRKIEVL